jgi:hypothetical protein
MASPCEHGNGPLGSMKDGEFVAWMSDCQLLKKDCFMEIVS